MRRNRLNGMTIGMIAICILALISTIFSLYSTAKLTEQINIINKNTYLVKGEIQTIRSRLSEIRMILPTLLENDNVTQKNEIYAILLERDKLQDETIQNIREHYLGPATDIDELQIAFAEIREVRLKAVEIYLPQSDMKEILEYFTDNVDPYNDQILKELKDIEDGVDKRMGAIAKESKTTQVIANTVAISLLVFIIAMIIYTSYNENKKNKEIAYRERLFDLLSTSTEDVFYIYSVSGKCYEYVSTNSKKLLGIESDIFYDKPLILKEYLSEESRKKYSEIVNAGDLFDYTECDLEFGKDGIDKNLKLRIYPVLLRKKLVRNIAVVSDQTETIAHQNVLKDALLSAQRANDAKRDFLSRMSHEIRTPMNTIIGMNTIALRHIDDMDYVINCLKKISFSSNHLLSLINDILDMSKIEDNKLSINHARFDLKKLIESVNTLIYHQAMEKDLTFDININGLTEETFIGDSLRVNQILINLLSNALKFTPNGGRIGLDISKACTKGKMIVIRFVIYDNGIGMSEEFMSRLFSPFEQADSMIAQKYGGTGLGMSITKNLVTLMNGIISVESELNEGTKITVELPFESIEQSFAPNKDFNDIKVLVVDDDQNTCEHAMILMEQIGIKASWVCSGKEAVESVMTAHKQDEDYDVCFIDWCMPEMDGVETARNIRKELGPDTLIIIISAYDWSMIENEAREAGVDAFVSKPIFISSIYDTLNTVILPKSGKTAKDIKEKQTQYDFKGKKVLLAEDNMINQEVATALLKEVGLDIECVENGELALEKFEASPDDMYAIILMDIQMPIMNGYEATRKIRKSAHTNAKSIPIIAMTANAFSEDVQLAKNAGMNGHVTKPIDIDILYKTLAEFIK